MNREIIDQDAVSVRLSPLTDEDSSAERLAWESGLKDIKSWLESQANDYPALELKWLLAHAEDGLIWGVLEKGELHISHQAAAISSLDEARDVSPPLMLRTLQTARLFGCKGEILLWRDGDNLFHARLITDDINFPEKATEIFKAYFDESQMLWGDRFKPAGSLFTLMTEGSQGLRHIAPCQIDEGEAKENDHPLRLMVRHYLTEDEIGFTRIAASRLRRLFVEKKNGEKS